MNLKNRLKPLTALTICAVALPLLVSACNSDNPLSKAQEGLCCKQFVVGADLSGADFKLTGTVNGEFKAFAQAGADLGAVAAASLSDVSVACESIARDVGASADDINQIDGMTGSASAKMTAWCNLATSTIKANFSASGKFKATAKAVFQPPKCSASVSAQAKCEGSCSADASCTADAMVTCSGGKLPSVECTGKCTGEANAAVSCTGSCSGKCSGGCTAQADVAVDCTGKCDGDCTVDGMAGSASGVQADGSCKGKCNGTCTATGGAKVDCSGKCEGSCEGSCEATAGAKFECNGHCTKDAGTPPKCEGSAELDCHASADCSANCQASASAKAECTPPKVSLELSANGSLSAEAQAQLDIAIASLETNLPQLFVVFKARGASFAAGIEGSVTAGASLTKHIGDFSGEAALCIPAIVAAIGSASTDFGASLSAAGSVSGAVGVTGS